MREIELTQGQVAKVDDWHFEELNCFKWRAQWNDATQNYYAIRTDYGFFKNRTIYMHRQIMKTPSDLECDHISHDTLDNQEHNLRNCTRSQNMMNQTKPRSDNSHGNLGVARSGTGWHAYIQCEGKKKWFPTRPTLEEALEDRHNAEAKYYGDFKGR